MRTHQRDILRKFSGSFPENAVWKTALLILFLIVTSCESSLIHDEVVFEGDQWKNAEAKQLSLQISDKAKYDVWVQVYYTGQWHHDYFNMALHMQTPFGETRYLNRSKRFVKDGKVQFPENQHGFYVAEIPYFRGLEVVEPGAFQFELLSRMPDYSVVGIHKVKVVMQQVSQ